MQPRLAVQRQPGRRDAQAGFTLIETLTAMLVFVFGIVAVTNLLLMAAASNGVANQTTATTEGASQQLDELRRMPFHSIAAGGNLTADAPGFSGDVDVPGVGMVHLNWVVTDSNNPPAGATPVIRARAKIIQMRAALRGSTSLGTERSVADFTLVRSCTNYQERRGNALCPCDPDPACGLEQ